jgi:2-amino-4-hydroxy-6-hydroxymethyldihydropteridine diphosphokinase
MIEKVILEFGSNTGSRLKNIGAAVKEISLNNGLNILALSPVYETEPWGYRNQRKFLNCAGAYLCRLSPPELMKTINKIEKKIGRTKRGKWQAREIDIDVLFYGNRVYKKNNLIIPHTFIQERNFVLKPLAELMPGFIHPVLNKSISFLYSHSKDNCKVKLYREVN